MSMRAASARLDALEVRRLLRREGLRASHARSQNFLADPDVLQAILDLAEAGPGTRVLEIGPGLGILTGGLLDSGAAVTAIELDAGLSAYLRARFAAPIEAGSLDLIEGDALDLELTSLLAAPYRVVANLPYHITSPTLHRLLGGEPAPERLVLMVQAEVAERIAAGPGRMSYLSVFVQYHATVRIVRRVPASAFEPAPAVESALIVVEPRRPGSIAPIESPGGAGAVGADTAGPDTAGLDTAGTGTADEELWALVQAGFRERRKMLHNVLVRQLGLPAARVDDALAAVGIERDRRPQTLSVDEWLALRAALDERAQRG
jgi:16S rRNA (adenine1518-N6/adenine1519-N6)-dimethyltransferase